WQADVQKQKIGRVFRRHPEGGLAVTGELHGIPVELQLQLVHPGYLRIVLDQEEPNHLIRRLRIWCHCADLRDDIEQTVSVRPASSPSGNRRCCTLSHFQTGPSVCASRERQRPMTAITRRPGKPMAFTGSREAPGG